MHQEQIVIEFDKDILNSFQQKLKENKSNERTDNNTVSQEDIKNIAINTANKLEQELSTEKYIKDVKEELGIKDQSPKKIITAKEENSLEVEKVYIAPVKEKIQNYNGPTRITCYLNNRQIRFTQIPVYKCQGGGIVKVAIVVDPKGKVIDSYIESNNINDECFSEASLQAAKLTSFNIDLNAEPREKGSITYEFVPQ
jgi:hypothetical protein